MKPRKLEHGFRRIRARILIIYLKGMRRMMFQLSASTIKGSILEGAGDLVSRL